MLSSRCLASYVGQSEVPASTTTVFLNPCSLPEWCTVGYINRIETCVGVSCLPPLGQSVEPPFFLSIIKVTVVLLPLSLTTFFLYL